MALNDSGMLAPALVDSRPRTLSGEDRERWEREFDFVRKQVEEGDPYALADAIQTDFLHFEAAVHHEERRLIADPLLWKDDDFALGRWIEGVYYTLARSAARVTGKLLDGERPTEADQALYARMAAISLAASGSSIKWSQIADAGRRPMLLKEAQAVLANAEAKGLAGTVTDVPIHDEKVSTPLTPLYVRAVLLDALCHGNLKRQQLGAIDTWLWEWVPAYPLVADGATGPSVRTGLPAQGAPAGSGAARVVSLEAMAEHLELATGWFREGRIYPGHGVATDLRIEDHVAALDRLRRFLAASRQKTGARQPRETRIDTVEVLVGLAEILGKGFLISVVADQDERPPAAARASKSASDSPFDIGDFYERGLRLMDLIDESPGGVGLEYDDSATPLDVGTLLGVRLDRREPVYLCEVVRRIGFPGGRSRIGARLLLGEKRKIRLVSDRWPEGLDAIYVAGEDPGGRADALLLSGTAADTSIVHDVRVSNQSFRVRVRRVRRRGHGWALAALEFVKDAAAG